MVAASVFLVAILLLGNVPTNEVSYNHNISELKTRITNYEIVMLQTTQDCNWEKNQSEINSCLNSKSQEALQILEIPFGNCSIAPYSSRKI